MKETHGDYHLVHDNDTHIQDSQPKCNSFGMKYPDWCQTYSDDGEETCNDAVGLVCTRTAGRCTGDTNPERFTNCKWNGSQTDPRRRCTETSECLPTPPTPPPIPPPTPPPEICTYDTKARAGNYQYCKISDYNTFCISGNMCWYTEFGPDNPDCRKPSAGDDPCPTMQAVGSTIKYKGTLCKCTPVPTPSPL